MAVSWTRLPRGEQAKCGKSDGGRLELIRTADHTVLAQLGLEQRRHVPRVPAAGEAMRDLVASSDWMPGLDIAIGKGWQFSRVILRLPCDQMDDIVLSLRFPCTANINASSPTRRRVIRGKCHALSVVPLPDDVRVRPLVENLVFVAVSRRHHFPPYIQQ